MRANTVSAQAVPLLDLAAQNAPLAEAIRGAIMRVVDSGQFILGEEVAAFEREAARYLGVAHAIGVSSGTDALLVALMALEVGPGDEVITTPFSFFATAGCVARLGAKPVFVDIDPETFNIDVGAVESAITPRTRAVVPVHLFGQPADLVRLSAVCAAHDLPIVEDAAQSFGATFEVDGTSRRAGTTGSLGCFSFFPSKNLGCFGDGGLIATDRDDLAERVRMLRAHGSEPKYYHRVIGGNFRLDALQAAVLRVKLPHLDGWTAARRQNAAVYDRMFTEAALPQACLRPPLRAHLGHCYNQYTIRTRARDGLREHLRSQQIGTEVYYPLPLHLQPCFEYLRHARGSFPESERAADEVLSLPIYAELAASSRRRVADTVLDYLRAL
jgi:dTDP-4-amino-4,6-dideoxygalactose transaminase